MVLKCTINIENELHRFGDIGGGKELTKIGKKFNYELQYAL